MEYVAIGAFVLLVGCLAWLSYRRRQTLNGCCAPTDPRDDLRMRAAFEGDENGDENGEPPARKAP